jgi:hypothetical protein
MVAVFRNEYGVHLLEMSSHDTVGKVFYSKNIKEGYVLGLWVRKYYYPIKGEDYRALLALLFEEL